MKTRSILMGLGLLIAGWLAFFGDKTGSSDIAEAVVRSSASAIAAAKVAHATPAPAKAGTASRRKSESSGTSAPEIVIATLQPREDLLGTDESTAATKSAATPTQTPAATPPAAEAMPAPLFGPQSWTPPPPPPPPPQPPPPPTAPPLPFAFIGKKLEDNTWEVYLSRGDSTFIVREASVIEQQYRIDAIKPPTLTLTYLPLNQVQSLNIGGTD
jgi:hypothetical protein